MNYLKLFIIALIAGTVSAFTLSAPKYFPAFSAATVDGTPVSNEIFKGRKNLVVLAHLGCPAFATFLQDVQDTPPEDFQIIYFLANTADQVKSYNSEMENNWSFIRKNFDLSPLNGHIIAECPEALHSTFNKPQCLKMSVEIGSSSSPTLVYVDEKGRITNTIEGYFANEDRGERLELLNENSKP